MKFNAAFLVALLAFAWSAPLGLAQLNFKGLTGYDFSRGTRYNAPTPPWQRGAKPGWYFGAHPERHPRMLCMTGWICRILRMFPRLPQCPATPGPQPTTTSTTATATSSTEDPQPTVPADGYTPVFENLQGATQGDGYLTFGLVDTVAHCKAMCDSIPECVFANTYNDVNGKGGSTQLTCSLFSRCHDASTATNTGGQSQPDGSINRIEDSFGWCKA